MHGNIRDYAVAATRYIIDLEERLDSCDGKIAGVNEWYARTGGRNGSATDD